MKNKENAFAERGNAFNGAQNSTTIKCFQLQRGLIDSKSEFKERRDTLDKNNKNSIQKRGQKGYKFCKPALIRPLLTAR